MTEISKELGLIINLHNVYHDHKKNCVDSSCNVSLHQIMEAARFLRDRTWAKEFDEATRLINNMKEQNETIHNNSENVS